MKKKPHSVDVHVGQKVQERRVLLGMNQENLGKAVDVSFQQIQKYERGDNRISASKLFMLSDVLQAPISYFFEGLKGQQPLPGAQNNTLTKRETLELCRYYYSLPNELRKQFFILVKKTAKYFSETSL